MTLGHRQQPRLEADQDLAVAQHRQGDAGFDAELARQNEFELLFGQSARRPFLVGRQRSPDRVAAVAVEV
jgi:hypothetical protein